MPASILRNKNNLPRSKWAGKTILPRKVKVSSNYPIWRKLLAIIKHRKAFLAAGWAVVIGRKEKIILDKKFSPRFEPTLGEYLNWYLTSKSFLHSIDWMGIPIRKMIADVWIYQEIIFETKPDIIIEIGSFYGGSTLFLAQMQELVGKGEVLSIDISHDYFMAKHPRISKITGDCSTREVVDKVSNFCKDKTVMVIHDGDHTSQAVERDLKIYAEFVTPGMYLIIEDGVVDLLNPKYSKLGRAYPDGGPLKAIKKIYSELEDKFMLDIRRERFILTTNPSGYWKRKESRDSTG